MAQLDPNAIAWDLGGNNLPVSGNEWALIQGAVIWDTHYSNEYAGGVYTPLVSGLYLCDPAFKLKDMVNVTGIEIGFFKGENLYFIVAGKQNIDAGVTDDSVRSACMLDLYAGDVCSFRIRLLGTDPTATISAEADTPDPADDLNDFTAWGLTYLQNIPGY